MGKSCPRDEVNCINCNNHFQQLRPRIQEIAVSKHFLRDAPDFDVNLIVDCKHQHFTHLHKFEESIQGNHIFRALWNGKHIVYAVDKNHRLVFLRAFRNVKQYEKFLDDKLKLAHMLEE